MKDAHRIIAMRKQMDTEPSNARTTQNALKTNMNVTPAHQVGVGMKVVLKNTAAK